MKQKDKRHIFIFYPQNNNNFHKFEKCVTCDKRDNNALTVQYSTLYIVLILTRACAREARPPEAAKGPESAGLEHTFYLVGRGSFRGMLAPLEEMQAYHGFFMLSLTT